MRAKFFYLLILGYLSSGCATIVSGTDQKVSFHSDPSDATVSVNGRAVGKTPLSLALDRDRGEILTFEKEGYEVYTSDLSTSVNPWFFGNIIIGGLFGSTTDVATGASMEYAPDHYYVTLTAKAPYGMERATARRVREAVIAFGPEIRLELNTDPGPYTDELIKLLGIEPEGQARAIRVLYQLSIDSENDFEFANQIIEVYDVE